MSNKIFFRLLNSKFSNLRLLNNLTGLEREPNITSLAFLFLFCLRIKVLYCMSNKVIRKTLAQKIHVKYGVSDKKKGIKYDPIKIINSSLSKNCNSSFKKKTILFVKPNQLCLKKLI